MQTGTIQSGIGILRPTRTSSDPGGTMGTAAYLISLQEELATGLSSAASINAAASIVARVLSKTGFITSCAVLSGEDISSSSAVWHEGFTDADLREIKHRLTTSQQASRLKTDVVVLNTQQAHSNETFTPAQFRCYGTAPILKHGVPAAYLVFASHAAPNLPDLTRSFIASAACQLTPFVISDTHPAYHDELVPIQGILEVLNELPFSIFLKNRLGRYVFVNKAFSTVIGLPAEEIIGQGPERIISLDAAAQSRIEDKQVLTKGHTVTIPELIIETPRGNRRVLQLTKMPFTQPGLSQPLVLGVALDISDLRRAREALRASEEHKTALLSAVPDLMFRFSPDGIYLDFHAASQEELVTPPEEFLGRSIDEILPPDLAREFRRNIVEAMQSGEMQTFEYSLDIPGKGHLDFEARMVLNNRKEILATIRNITKRKQNERDLVVRLRYERALAECSRTLLRADAGSRDSINDAVNFLREATGACRIYIFENFAHPDLGLCCQQTHEVCAPGIVPQMDNPELQLTPYSGTISRWQHILERGDPVSGAVREFPQEEQDILLPQDIESLLVLPINVGSTWWGFMGLDDTSEVRDWSENEIRLLRTAADMIGAFIEREKAEYRLKDSERKFREFADNVKEVFWLRSTERFTYVSPAFLDVWGRTPDALEADPGVFTEAVHPEDREQAVSALYDALVSGTPWAGEFRIVRPDGSVRWIWARSFPVMRDDRSFRAVGVAEDITERKRAEEEREVLQRQFLQAQKMEVIGRLAGGVAHDFNNLLLPIMGYADMGILQIEEEHPLHGDLQQIRDAADRAAGLTRQLLSFSRKQVLDMKTVCLNSVLTDFTGMIRRSLGERIVFTTDLAEDIGAVKADPGQIEQVIMNLAINARDAMENGGHLRITTRNAELDEQTAKNHAGAKPGQYVMLKVSDTGHGMDADTKSRLFEPFFTTKERSKGTGLGLATVYGIVKQHGGTIWVDSEPGRGTSFTLYFPRLHEGRSSEVRRHPKDGVRGSEMVLVVEDEEMARELVENILIRYGYNVTALSGPKEAIEFSDRYGGYIDILVTDIMMPNMNGSELYRVLHEARPDMKVLFMSGYTGDVILEKGFIEKGQPLLRKPFTVHGLTEKVRGVLEGE